MADATDRLPPSEDPDEVSTGEMFREVLFFAAVVGAIAGGGYGLFAGYADWHHAAQTAEKKSAMVILRWGAIWAVGGATAITLLCGSIVGIFLGTTKVLRRLVGR